MAKKQSLTTDRAPRAIGTYSQAIRADNTIYISGQIPLLPESMTLVSQNIDEQIQQVMNNLDAVCQNAGGNLDAVVKFTVYLTDLNHFDRVNTIMKNFLSEPFPARAVVEVAALPKQSQIEIDAIMVI
jgi:reactive intermediate/imine deaminase